MVVYHSNDIDYMIDNILILVISHQLGVVGEDRKIVWFPVRIVLYRSVDDHHEKVEINAVIVAALTLHPITLGASLAIRLVSTQSHTIPNRTTDNNIGVIYLDIICCTIAVA